MYYFTACNWGLLCLFSHLYNGFKCHVCHVWIQGLDVRLWMFLSKAQSLAFIYTHTQSISVGWIWFITSLVWIEFSSPVSRARLHPKWVSLITTDLNDTLCHFLLIPNCCNLMGAGQGRCPKLLLDLLAILCPLVKYTSIPSPWIDTVLHIMYTNLQTSGGRSEGEISNSFALALVAALHSTWLITVGNI